MRSNKKAIRRTTRQRKNARRRNTRQRKNTRRRNTRRINTRRRNTIRINTRRRLNTRRRNTRQKDKIKGGVNFLKRIRGKSTEPKSPVKNLDELEGTDIYNVINFIISEFKGVKFKGNKDVKFKGNKDNQNLLGSGAAGSVFKYTDGGKINDETKCIKISMIDFSEKSFLNEVKIMETINRVNNLNSGIKTLQLLGAYETTDAYGIIIMERLNGSSLEDKLKGDLSLDDKKSIVISLFNSLQLLNVNGIAHNDLKPDNILVIHNNISVIIDFGESRFIQGNGIMDQTLDPPKGSGDYSLSDTRYPYDLHSFCIILIEMFIKDGKGLLKEKNIIEFLQDKSLTWTTDNNDDIKNIIIKLLTDICKKNLKIELVGLKEFYKTLEGHISQLINTRFTVPT